MIAARAGLLYFFALFIIGFLLGTIRVLLLVPRLGETPAVLLELPIMLAAAWLLCRQILRHIAVPLGAPRLGMGAIFLALLLLAEVALGWAMGSPPGKTIAGWASLPGALGLAAQVVAAALPLLQRR